MSKSHLFLFGLVLLFTLSDCSSSKKMSTAQASDSSTATSAHGTGDGTSFENAVFINQTNSGAGIDAEYKWIKEHYPDSKVLGQKLVSKGKTPYDVIMIETTTGEKKDIHFDISKFFGKF